MATAFKCDRCKRLLEGRPRAAVTVATSRPRPGQFYTREMHLCDDCEAALDSFLHDPNLCETPR